jgi:hypothetical protein
MKKFVTMSFVMLVVLGSTRAQLQQGNFLIGSDMARLQLGLNEGSKFDIDINPKLAFFVRNNLALGAYLHFSLNTSKGAGADVGYGIGPMGRYYISDPTINVLRHARFFFEANAGIEGTNPASGDNTNGLGLGIGPGLAYFITPNVGLEGLLKYQGIVGFGSETTSSALILSLGLQIYLPTARIKARVEEMKN